MSIAVRIPEVCSNVFHEILFQEVLALRGNHEAVLTDFLRQPSVADNWRHLGGLEKIAPVWNSDQRIDAWERLRGSCPGIEQPPKEHLTFLSSLKNSITIGEYFLCHAGIRPNIPLDRQNVNDLLWICNQFLNSDLAYEKMVIHGHSPNEWPEVKPNRVNIDTGVFATAAGLVSLSTAV